MAVGVRVGARAGVRAGVRVGVVKEVRAGVFVMLQASVPGSRASATGWQGTPLTSCGTATRSRPPRELRRGGAWTTSGKLKRQSGCPPPVGTQHQVILHARRSQRIRRVWRRLEPQPVRLPCSGERCLNRWRWWTNLWWTTLLLWLALRERRLALRRPRPAVLLRRLELGRAVLEMARVVRGRGGLGLPPSEWLCVRRTSFTRSTLSMARARPPTLSGPRSGLLLPVARHPTCLFRTCAAAGATAHRRRPRPSSNATLPRVPSALHTFITSQARS